jgi:hypothetical protein
MHQQTVNSGGETVLVVVLDCPSALAWMEQRHCGRGWVRADAACVCVMLRGE